MIVKIWSVLAIWTYGHMYFWGQWWMFWLYFPYVKRSTRDIYSWFFMNRPNLSIIDSRFSRIKTLSRSAWLITHKSTINSCSWTNIKLSLQYKICIKTYLLVSHLRNLLCKLVFYRREEKTDRQFQIFYHTQYNENNPNDMTDLPLCELSRLGLFLLRSRRTCYQIVYINF